jgi:hypothetical protein
LRVVLVFAPSVPPSLSLPHPSLSYGSRNREKPPILPVIAGSTLREISAGVVVVVASMGEKRRHAPSPSLFLFRRQQDIIIIVVCVWKE